MLNILHIIEDLETGGAERRLVNDIKYIDRNMFSHTICVLRLNVEMKDTCLSGIPFYRYEVDNLADIFKNIFSMNRIVSKHHIDIIHTQLFWADLAGRVLKVINQGVKLVSTIQSSAHEHNGSELYSHKRKILDSISGRLLNDGFIAVSEYAKNVSIKEVKFPPEKIKVIYNSVDLECGVLDSKTRGLREEFGIIPQDKILISMGRFVPAKGHIYLIRAMAMIKERPPEIKLLLVGDGPGKNDLVREAAELGVSSNIIFTGKRSDARDILALGDVFIFPSLYGEGLPLALLEAMAAGMPCIVTSTGPNSEVIEDGKNGIIIKPAHPKEIAGAVLDLFSRPDKLSKFGKLGLQTVKDRFSAFSSARMLEEYYVKIANNKNIDA